MAAAGRPLRRCRGGGGAGTLLLVRALALALVMASLGPGAQANHIAHNRSERIERAGGIREVCISAWTPMVRREGELAHAPARCMHAEGTAGVGP